MRYKIQVCTINGWGDLKSSVDGSTYQTDFYATKKEALQEIKDMGGLDPSAKVVNENVKEDDDLYSFAIKGK